MLQLHQNGIYFAPMILHEFWRPGVRIYDFHAKTPCGHLKRENRENQKMHAHLHFVILSEGSWSQPQPRWGFLYTAHTGRPARGREQKYTYINGISYIFQHIRWAFIGPLSASPVRVVLESCNETQGCCISRACVLPSAPGPGVVNNLW